ncbi:MAG: arsinothricin resistance N-acetyltransferase ArsN1 family B [Vicinamibacterales bacterium]
MPSIRLASDADGVALAAIYGPIVAATTISFEIDPPDASEMARRVRESGPTYPWLVCERGRQVAGYAYASAHRARAGYRWSVDVSVYVGERFRRCGVGRGLYESLFAILAAQGFVSAFAGIALPNPASIGLHEAMGFTPVGVYRNVGHKQGAWRDVGWWQLPLAAATTTPSPITPIPRLQQAGNWDAIVSRGLVAMSGRGR